jgi:hypothetical protein
MCYQLSVVPESCFSPIRVSPVIQLEKVLKLSWAFTQHCPVDDTKQGDIPSRREWCQSIHAERFFFRDPSTLEEVILYFIERLQYTLRCMIDGRIPTLYVREYLGFVQIDQLPNVKEARRSQQRSKLPCGFVAQCTDSFFHVEARVEDYSENLEAFPFWFLSR